MAINKDTYLQLIESVKPNVTVVAVSKTQSVENILELYNLGQRHFGENYVQELTDKQQRLPKDILWHFIGHLQTNKVKFIAPFVHLIHSADSFKLITEINKQGQRNNRIIDILLQVHIAKEETKFGFDKTELHELLDADSQALRALKNVHTRGLMGMASFTPDKDLIRTEFHYLKQLFDTYAVNTQLETLSMGMSSDYLLAVEEGSNLVRIGSLIFGERRKA